MNKLLISKRLEEFPLSKLFYKTLLLLYPKDYRSEYDLEMRLLFEDLYKEEKMENGEVRLKFWLSLVWDVLTSTISQHYQLIQEIGPRRYLKQMLSINIVVFFISLLLLTPFFSVMLIDTFVLLLTGSRQAMSVFYNSPFWSVPVILTAVLFLPLIVVLMNALVITQEVEKRKYKIISISFIGQNFFNLVILMVGLSAIFILFGHDLVPCIINRTFHSGFLKLIPNFNYCRVYS